MGTEDYPGSPLCLMDMSVFIPKVVNSLRTITAFWEPGQVTYANNSELHISIWGKMDTLMDDSISL